MPPLRGSSQERRQDHTLFGIQIEPLLRRVAEDVRQEEAGGEKERLRLLSLLQLIDGPYLIFTSKAQCRKSYLGCVASYRVASYLMSVISYVLLLLSALWLISVSIFSFVRPRLALICLGKMASTNRINYTELTLRLISGLAFVNYAGRSRAPELFLVIGWFFVATAVILMLTPRRWHAAYAVFWSRKLTPAVVRFAAPLSFLCGVLLIVAIH